MALKDALTLIPRTYKYVILHGKKDFADITKVIDRILAYLTE